ncbi:hypothetical protein PCASD_16721 [Puccinia coronata f. sp. avenae]|uniref:Uncharacterized protein n=1 Tax=Puccinia coronata f. sp. avenae TaxID=200324 RepID=A0A2N5TX72_9BASI|nr:hypothetical protein PCASD_16721 [Puccinia coronata f. sp. avenae]
MVAAWSSILTLTKHFCPVALSQYLSRQDWSTALCLCISQQSLALTALHVCPAGQGGRGNNNNNKANLVDAGVTLVCVLPHGSLLPAGLLDTVVRLWDTLKGLLLNKLQRHKDLVYLVAFSPNGKFLVSGSLNKSLKLWDLFTLNRDGNPPCNSTPPPPLAAAKNNKNHLLSQQSQQQQNANTTSSTSGAGGANTAALLSLAARIVKRGKQITGNCSFNPLQPSTASTTTLMGHKHYVLSVAVSRDGKWISCKIRSVQFWDPKNRHGPVHVAGPRELGYLLGEQVKLLAKLPAWQAGLPAGQAGTCLASRLTCWPSYLLGKPVYLLAKQVPAAQRAS